MKGLCMICLLGLPCLLILFTSKGFCQQHCQWGPFEEWSECDGCTKTQTRSRSISVYSTSGGRPCDGARIEIRRCETTKSCPLSHGCGERFRCRSGMCISQSLKCNGDQDCEEDQEDERSCERKQHFVCQIQRPPPNIELLGVGIDIATGKSRGLVINTKSFGGQCRKIDNNAYRLPEGLLMYTNLVKVQNDLNDEMFETEWHYAKDIVKRETVSGTASGYRNYDYHETDVRKRRFHLMVLQNDIEIATFQSNSPKYIPIAEEFWKALMKLPTVYNYGAYRKVLEQFGTHYISEGALGGSLKVIARLDHNERTNKIIEYRSHNVCTKTKRFILFFPIYHTSCDDDAKDTSRNPHDYKNTITVGKVYTEGGSPALQAQLQDLQSTKPENNWKIYTDWAASVRSFPKVIKQKLRPLSELVKEVHCAGVKKLYLRNAIEKYLYETDPCNCPPCGRNGVAVIENYECRCIVKPGSEAEDPNRMEIDGNWACWSVWGPCSGGRRSRSRSCTNPPPQNGGQHCIGKSSEMGECEEEELQYLRNFEPECFDMTLPPSLKCGPPPALINGYILDPKDIYLEGHRAEYRCISGFHVSGQSTLECSASQTWSGTLGVCQLSNCMMPLLPAGLKVSPDKNTYPIGDSVTLSCPEGKELQGEAESICDASLNFSPDPTLVTCKQVSTGPDTGSNNTTVQCKIWEKEAKGKCICKLPYECGDSLELCASNPIIGHAAVVTVCKMHALKCMKKDIALAEDSLCDWSMQTANRACSKCHMWETCDGQTNTCVCRASSDCLSPGLSVCVRIGENPAAASQTMSECEAGLRRCRGDKVTVVKIVPCSA